MRLFALPRWEQKAINDPSLPDIAIAGRRKLTRVAGDNSCIVRQVVVESKVGALCIRERQAVAHDRIAAEGLLHAEDRLGAPHPAIEAAKGAQAVVGFQPIALCVMPTRKFGAQAKAGIERLPPEMRAVKVLSRALQQAVVGETELQATFRQEQAGATAGGALGVELLIPTARGEPSRVINGVFAS